MFIDCLLNQRNNLYNKLPWAYFTEGMISLLTGLRHGSLVSFVSSVFPVTRYET